MYIFKIKCQKIVYLAFETFDDNANIVLSKITVVATKKKNNTTLLKMLRVAVPYRLWRLSCNWVKWSCQVLGEY